MKPSEILRQMKAVNVTTEDAAKNFCHTLWSNVRREHLAELEQLNNNCSHAISALYFSHYDIEEAINQAEKAGQ